ncbi:ABC transporter ATP-binding protein [Paraburkholderia fungorum]|uniref:ABC transporter ATP-binding protein n=1 Tax=Paraburkholderia fungorum TaxID=134537 RepID=UPI00248F3813|nr:ABC transporter ATP-binding protein [Paraburkholderia fungorum]
MPGNLLTVTRAGKRFTISRRQRFGVRQDIVRAVDDVTFAVREGESFGIVGESGSGKSTLARLILGLSEPTSGSVTYCGKEVRELCRGGRRDYWREVQVIFQDPFSSLNPRMQIGSILSEPLKNYGNVNADQRPQRIAELLELVGLPVTAASRFPHELSGGQRQRVAIAAALAVDPRVIVADESVSALDVSVQAQIVNLLLDLKRQLGLTYVFITHNLNLSAYFCDRIAVLYLGQVMEICDASVLLREPMHPYTQALISAVPSMVAANRKPRTVLIGEIPSPISPPSGCPFHPRCPRAINRCLTERPELMAIASGHQVACHVAQSPVGLIVKSNLSSGVSNENH